MLYSTVYGGALGMVGRMDLVLKDTFSGLFCLTVERDVLLSEWRLW